MSPPLSKKAHEILDAAEIRIRHGGFKAASFRDVAADVGIKSASVHYHFPQKTDLGRAVVERYTDRMLEALGSPNAPNENIEKRLERLISVYEQSLTQGDAVCLCAVLGAAAKDLPEDVATAVQTFFTRVLLWVEQALGNRPDAGRTAARVIATLQGAMILALAREDPRHLSDVGMALRKEFRS